jgi:polyribonucleotide nucleotidyltransferase
MVMDLRPQYVKFQFILISL